MPAISMVAGPGASGSGGSWAGAPVGQVSALGRSQPPGVYLAGCWAAGGGQGGPQGPLPSQQLCWVAGAGEGSFERSWVMPGLCLLPGTRREGQRTPGGVIGSQMLSIRGGRLPAAATAGQSGDRGSSQVWLSHCNVHTTPPRPGSVANLDPPSYIPGRTRAPAGRQVLQDPPRQLPPLTAHLPDEAVGGGVGRGAAIRALEAALALAVLALRRGEEGQEGSAGAPGHRGQLCPPAPAARDALSRSIPALQANPAPGGQEKGN